MKLTQVTPAELAAELAAYLQVDAAFNAERTKRQGLSDVVRAAQEDLAAWLQAVKSALVGSFGTRWNADWIAVGFITPSLEIPGTLSQQASLGIAMTAFLTKNPSYEVPKTNVTAAQGAALQTALTGSKQALKDEEAAYNSLSTQWDTAWQALTGTMRSLVRILQGSLGKNDPRWLDFGLPMPGTPATPGKPVNLSAHLDQTGAIIVQCDAVPLATRYRWRTLLVGLQSDYVLSASTTEPLGSLPGFVPGQPVQIIVQAVNGKLQGVASEPIVFTIPAVRASEPKPAQPKAAAAESPASNGHSNGNGNGNGHSIAKLSRVV